MVPLVLDHGHLFETNKEGAECRAPCLAPSLAKKPRLGLEKQLAERDLTSIRQWFEAQRLAPWL